MRIHITPTSNCTPDLDGLTARSKAWQDSLPESDGIHVYDVAWYRQAGERCLIGKKTLVRSV